MKTKIILIAAVLFGIVAIVFSSSAFVVEEGQQVIVTEFGRPVREIRDAGLYFKSPFIQDIHVLEKRLLPWDGDPESMQTKDKKRIDIDVWARWRIIEPDRKSVVEGKSVDLGGRRIIKKQKNKQTKIRSSRPIPSLT